MKIEQHALIDEMIFLTDTSISKVKAFQHLTDQALNHKPHPKAWSILECVQHLILYGNFYLPEIEKQLAKSSKIDGNRAFTSGMLGDYFVRLIKVDNGKTLTATKAMDSTGSNISREAIDQLLKQLEQLNRLLSKSKNVHLNKVKTAISLTKFVKLRLGDTFRFLVYHNERHIQQAERVLNTVYT